MAEQVFQISEGSQADIAETARIFIAAMAEDDMRKPLTKNVSPEDDFQWTHAGFQSGAWLLNKRLFLVTETATAKVVGYASMAIPYTITEEETAIRAGTPAPLLPNGINENLWRDMGIFLALSKKHGYDSEEHYHRHGIMILPAYRRQGLGTMLAQRCDEVESRTGGTTYVIAKYVAKLMFEKHGFKVLEAAQLDMTTYGGGPDDGKVWVMAKETTIHSD